MGGTQRSRSEKGRAWVRRLRRDRHGRSEGRARAGGETKHGRGYRHTGRGGAGRGSVGVAVVAVVAGDHAGRRPCWWVSAVVLVRASVGDAVQEASGLHVDQPDPCEQVRVPRSDGREMSARVAALEVI